MSQFLWIRNSEVAELGGSGSSSLTRLCTRCQPGLESSEGLTGAGVSDSKMAHLPEARGLNISSCCSLWRTALASSWYEKLASPRASLDPGFKIPDDSLEVTEHYFYQFLSHKVLRPAQIQREQSQRISAIWSLLQSPWIAFCILLWIQREATGGFKYRNSRMLFLFLKDHLAAREYIEWGQDRKQGDKLATSMVVWMAAVEQEKSGD